MLRRRGTLALCECGTFLVLGQPPFQALAACARWVYVITMSSFWLFLAEFRRPTSKWHTSWSFSKFLILWHVRRWTWIWRMSLRTMAAAVRRSREGYGVTWPPRASRRFFWSAPGSLSPTTSTSSPAASSLPCRPSVECTKTRIAPFALSCSTQAFGKPATAIGAPTWFAMDVPYSCRGNSMRRLAPSAVAGRHSCHWIASVDERPE
mmetsp:Transcript_128925/g.237169  ORF Transcript_128925/g.237169 Transcript_128925/m.237169 type:complete len:207 (+) Transcript_128925:539-1159(+)